MSREERTDFVQTLLAEAKILVARSEATRECAAMTRDRETVRRADDMVECSGNMLRYLRENKERLL